MLLKNHLIEVFKKASLENNFLLKENIIFKWVHRFGIDSLNDLLIHSSLQKENQYKQENQQKIKRESTDLQTSWSNEIICKNQDSNKIERYNNTQKLPLPYIKNLRKWINNDKKAS